MKKILIFFLVLFVTVGCTQKDVEEEPKEEVVEDVVEEKEKVNVDFVAVGDNLIHGAIYVDQRYVNNNYDYTPIYEHIKPFIEDVDVSYINQETILGGREIGLESYPLFNSPQEIGDAVYETGFDWVNHATNHTLDMGAVGVERTLDFWDKYPEVKVTGIARNQEEADALTIIEREGVKFGLLSYTYGTNGIPVPEGQDYLVNLIDKDKIEADITRLRSEVDSVLVSMHWGTEYSFVQDEVQEDLAQFLADLHVDVIVGSHPHVIQPMDYVTGKDGNETLVIYSLGNFLSAQDVNYRMLGGMANWTLEFDPNTKSTSVKDVSFTPVINHFDYPFNNFRVYRLKDYTNDLASTHGLSGQQDVSVEYFKNLVDETMNDKVEIIY